MKLLCTLFCLGFAALPVSASDVEQNRAEEVGKTYKVFKTRLNTMYKDVTVTKITDAGISIIHSEGTARLGYERLTPEQRNTFGITEEGAAAMHAKEEQNKASYEAHIAAKRKAWQDEQADRQIERQQAYEAVLAQQTVARMEAERSEALRAMEQPAKTSIVSVVEVPTFPIIRGHNNQILQPIPNTSRPQRRTYSRNSNTIYYGGHGGTYGYPVRYGSSYGGTYGTPCYPSHYSRGGTYRPSYNRGNAGWINYRKGDFNIGVRW